jgi:hypothetical protein
LPKHPSSLLQKITNVVRDLVELLKITSLKGDGIIDYEPIRLLISSASIYATDGSLLVFGREMFLTVGSAILRGPRKRFSRRPAQLGQTFSRIIVAQCSQNVHSKLQIIVSLLPFGRSLPQFSQIVLN